MNLLLSARKDEFWFDFYDSLKSREDLSLVYWVGARAINRELSGCFDHDGWDAFSLHGKCESIKETHLLDLDKISREEYYNYLKILDRVDSLDNFSFSERDQLFKRQLTYWLSVLENKSIDFVVFSNAPHMPFDYPLYLSAKIKGIKTLMWYVTPIKGWHYLKEDIGFESPIDLSEFSISGKEFYENIVSKFKFQNRSEMWYMKIQREADSSFKTKVKELPFIFALRKLRAGIRNTIIGRKNSVGLSVHGKYASIKTNSAEYNSTSISFFDLFRIKKASKNKKKRIFKEYNYFSRKVDAKKLDKYLFFPLHYQPEQTTTPLGGDFSDQIFLIQEVSKILPSNVTLVVKEHPSQFSSKLHGNQGRHIGYWQSISNLPNVIISDLSETSENLIKHSIGVITITGTAGWEALVNGIRCFVFGCSWYSGMPGVTRVSKENLKDIFSDIDKTTDSSRAKESNFLEYSKYFTDLDIHDLERDNVDSRARKNSEILIKKMLDIKYNFKI